VFGGAIRAKCTSSVARCAAWQTVPLATVSIGSPSPDIDPTPVLTFPAVISYCSDLMVDTSASTGQFLSFGSGRVACHLPLRADVRFD
jgi:hypothetical protein